MSVEDLKLTERIEYLLKSSEYSDCTFKVGEICFKAHRLILSVSSNVFRTMFNGHFLTTGDINIPDIEPKVFKWMLDYIYTDKVNIDSMDKAYSLLYAAEKYMLKRLIKKCTDYMKENIDMDCALTIYSNSTAYCEVDLGKYALKFILAHADPILAKFLKDISPECMKSILESDDVNMNEKDLIIAVARWSLMYCKNHNKPTSVESQRKVIMEFEFHKLLRFLSLSVRDLKEVMFATMIITQDEFLSILHLELNDGAANDLLDTDFVQCFNRSPRVLKHLWLCTNYFSRGYVHTHHFVQIDEGSTTIQARIRSNSTVFLKALSIPTQELCYSPVEYPNSTFSYTEEMVVFVTSQGTERSTYKINYRNSVEFNSTQLIEIKKPCILNKDIWYLLTFQFPRNKLSENKYRLQSSVKVGPKDKFKIDDMSLVGGSFIMGIKYSH